MAKISKKNVLLLLAGLKTAIISNPKTIEIGSMDDDLVKDIWKINDLDVHLDGDRVCYIQRVGKDLKNFNFYRVTFAKNGLEMSFGSGESYWKYDFNLKDDAELDRSLKDVLKIIDDHIDNKPKPKIKKQPKTHTVSQKMSEIFNQLNGKEK